jgi:hypothetical protein
MDESRVFYTISADPYNSDSELSIETIIGERDIKKQAEMYKKKPSKHGL